MKTKIFSLVILAASLSFSAFAGSPKGETKDATASATTGKTKEAEVKWFHFTGNASLSADLQNPAKYEDEDESGPTCTSTSLTYRCDIQILEDENNPGHPDLTQAVQAERKRATAQ